MFWGGIEINGKMSEHSYCTLIIQYRHRMYFSKTTFISLDFVYIINFNNAKKLPETG